MEKSKFYLSDLYKKAQQLPDDEEVQKCVEKELRIAIKKLKTAKTKQSFKLYYIFARKGLLLGLPMLSFCIGQMMNMSLPPELFGVICLAPFFGIHGSVYYETEKLHELKTLVLTKVHERISLSEMHHQTHMKTDIIRSIYEIL